MSTLYDRISDQNLIIDQSNLNGNIKVLADIRNSDTCLSLKINPSGSAYAVALADGIVNVYQTKNDRLIYILNEGDHRYGATCVRFRPWGRENINPNNLLIATFTNGKVKTYHYPTGECVSSENRETITCEYSKFGDTFATSGGDGKLHIYDDETRQILRTYEPPFYAKPTFRRVYSIAYNPQATDELITGGWDDTVRYYDLRIPNVIKQFHGPHVCGEGLTFDPSGKEICSASWRPQNSLQLWDYGSGQLIKTIAISPTRMSARSAKSGYCVSGSSTSDSNESFCLPPISERNSRRNTQIIVKFNEPHVKLTRPTLPTMLYSCRYFINSDIIAFSGAEGNALGVINKHTDKVVTSIFGLQRNVYSLDTYRSKIALISGKGVALVDVYM